MGEHDELYEQLNQLIHDAEHLETGAEVAEAMGDRGYAEQARGEAAAKRARAAELDPDARSGYWPEYEASLRERESLPREPSFADYVAGLREDVAQLK